MIFCDELGFKIFRKNGNFYTTLFQTISISGLGEAGHAEYTSDGQFLLTIHISGYGLVHKRNDQGKFEEKVRVYTGAAGSTIGAIKDDHTKILINEGRKWMEYTIDVDTNTSSKIDDGNLGTFLQTMKYKNDDKMFLYYEEFTSEHFLYRRSNGSE